MVFQETVDLLLQFHGEGISTAKHTHQKTQVCIFQFRDVQKSIKDGGYSRDKIGLSLDQHLCVGFAVKVWHQDTAGPVNQDGVQVYTKPKTMEKRHAA